VGRAGDGWPSHFACHRGRDDYCEVEETASRDEPFAARRAHFEFSA